MSLVESWIRRDPPASNTSSRAPWPIYRSQRRHAMTFLATSSSSEYRGNKPDKYIVEKWGSWKQLSSCAGKPSSPTLRFQTQLQTSHLLLSSSQIQSQRAPDIRIASELSIVYRRNDQPLHKAAMPPRCRPSRRSPVSTGGVHCPHAYSLCGLCRRWQ